MRKVGSCWSPNGELPPQQLQEQREGAERRTRGDKSRKSRERNYEEKKKGGGGILSYMSAFLAEIESRHEDKYWRV